ncbi:hypothetical protein COCOBI_09-4600 [Coccomyxa sp. Obi]|nr:hypothetical protein COCOBI_09-4600 [Coccomyxa sp. Obi]
MLNLLLDVKYLIPRVVIWVLLFAAALTDTIRHRHVKRRGHQLQRGVLFVICAFIVQDILLLAYAAQKSAEDPHTQRIYLAYIFFTDFADSSFIALLLLIAAGYCITRDNLGPYKQKVLYIPAVYLFTTLVVDYIINAVKSTAPGAELSEEQDIDIRDGFSGWEWIVLNICEIASILALILAWVYIFDTVLKEREKLESPQEGIVGAVPRDVENPSAPEQAVSTNGATGRATGPSNGNVHADEGVGHNVDLPAEVLLDGNTVLSDHYAEVTDNDTDAVKTVEERLDHRSKLRLMSQFMFGVGGYIIARIAAILLPLFFVNQPGQEDLAIRIVLILENVVLWAFLAALAFIFRLRPDNPYLLLDEFGEGNATDGGLTTELGVMGNEEAEGHGGGRGGAGFGSAGAVDMRGAAGGGHSDSIDRKFSLGEEEDVGSPTGVRAGGVSQPRSRASTS